MILKYFSIIIIAITIYYCILIGYQYDNNKTDISPLSGDDIIKFTNKMSFPRFPMKNPQWKDMNNIIKSKLHEIKEKSVLTSNNFYYEHVVSNCSGFSPASLFSKGVSTINELIGIGGYICRIVPRKIIDRDDTSSLCLVSHMDSHYNTIGYTDNLLSVSQNLLLLDELIDMNDLKTPITVIFTDSEEQSLNSIWGLIKNVYVEKCGLSIVVEGMGCAVTKPIISGSHHSGKILELAFKENDNGIFSGMHDYIRATPLVMDLTRITHGSSSTESVVLSDKTVGTCGEICNKDSKHGGNILEVIYSDETFKYHTLYDNGKCVNPNAVKARYDMMIDVSKRIGRLSNEIYKKYLNEEGIEGSIIIDKYSIFIKSETLKMLGLFNVATPLLIIILAPMLNPVKTKKPKQNKPKKTSGNTEKKSIKEYKEDIEKPEVINYGIYEAFLQYLYFIGGYIMAFFILILFYFIWFKIDAFQTQKASFLISIILFLLPPLIVYSITFKLVHPGYADENPNKIVYYSNESGYICLIFETIGIIGMLLYHFKLYISGTIIIPTSILIILYLTSVLLPAIPKTLFLLTGLLSTIVNLFTYIPCLLPIVIQYPRDHLAVIGVLLPLVGGIIFGPLFMGILLYNKEKNDYLPHKYLFVAHILVVAYSYTLPAFTEEHPFSIHPGLHHIINPNKSIDITGLYITSGSQYQISSLKPLLKLKGKELDNDLLINDVIYHQECYFNIKPTPCYELSLYKNNEKMKYKFEPDFNNQIIFSRNYHYVLHNVSFSSYTLDISCKNFNITGSRIINVIIKSDNRISLAVTNGHNVRKYAGTIVSVIIQTFIPKHKISFEITSEPYSSVNFIIKDVVRHNPSIIEPILKQLGKTVAIFGKSNYIGPQAIIHDITYDL